MKTELRLRPYTTREAKVIEVWYGGCFVATMSEGAEGEGVTIRVISKYFLSFQTKQVENAPTATGYLGVTEIRFLGLPDLPGIKL